MNRDNLTGLTGREAPATILVGIVDEPILGAAALGLTVDPRWKRLSPSRPCAWAVTTDPLYFRIDDWCGRPGVSRKGERHRVE